MILCTFFIGNPWFNACVNFLICITYSVLPCKLAKSFSTFSIFILSCKKVSHSEGYVNFWDIEHQLEKNIFHHYTFISQLSCK